MINTTVYKNKEQKLRRALRKEGYSAKDYVAAWQMYANASGEGKKRRTIQAYMDRFGVDWDTAAAIYDIYG